MFISADQLLCHAVGDYLLQSDWMALNKTKRWVPAIVHALTYAIPFLFLCQSLWAMLVIIGTHAVIDRLRLARYVVWAKNWFAPWVGEVVEPSNWSGDSPRSHRWRRPNPPWAECRGNGYPADRPAWLTTWLLIIADNVIHVIINGIALRYL
mgnify:FL=1